MTLRTLIESLHRLYTDPRVSPNTEVEVEIRHDVDTHFEDFKGGPVKETLTICEPALALAVASMNGGRTVVLSAIAREDAIAR